LYTNFVLGLYEEVFIVNFLIYNKDNLGELTMLYEKLCKSALDYYTKYGWLSIPQRADRKPFEPHKSFKPTRESLRRLFTKWRQCKYIAIVAGSKSNLIVVDVDVKDDQPGLKSLAKLQKDYGKLPRTYTVRTKSGGQHLYFHYDWPVDKSTWPRSGELRDYLGIECKGQNQLVTAWPSPGYTVVYDSKVAEIPDWLVELARQTKSVNRDDLEPSEASHNRNEYLTRLAGSLRAQGCDTEETQRELLKANAKIDKPLGEAEVIGLAKKTVRWRVPEWNDLTLADIYAKAYQGQVYYNTDTKSWLVYESGRWVIDKGLKTERLAEELVRYLRKQCNTKKQRVQLSKYFSNYGIHGFLDRARAREVLQIERSRLDTQGYLFNCANGTIDLRTGVLQKHSPNDFITKLARVEYPYRIGEKPRVGASLAAAMDWHRCLKEWMGNNRELLQYLQNIFGYCLTTHTQQKIFIMFVGPSDTGKTTCVETIARQVMGSDYAGMAPQNLFASSGLGDRHPAELETLRGKRLIFLDEPECNRKTRVNLIKTLTGSSVIQSRAMRQDFTPMELQAKIIMMSNRDLEMEEDEALWRRVKKIPWSYPVPLEKQDKYLQEDLAENAGWILAWLVEGAMKWYKTEDIVTPAAVEQATEEYRLSQNPLRDFAEEYLNKTQDTRDTLSSKRMYKLYTSWARKRRQAKLCQRDFGSQLKRIGFESATIRGEDGHGNYWVRVEIAKYEGLDDIFGS